MSLSTFYYTANNAIGTIQNNPLTSGGTNLIVSNNIDAKLAAISTPYFVTLWGAGTDPNNASDVEIVLVTNRASANNYTITRAQQSTSAVSHAQNDNVALLYTKGNDDQIRTNLQQIETDLTNDVATLQAGIQANSYTFATDSSVSANTITVTLSPVPGSYTTGMGIIVKVANAVTGATVINVNTLGNKSVVKNFNAALVTGDVLANQTITLIYDGTNFQMQSPSAISALTSAVFLGTGVDGSVNINSGSFSSGPITSNALTRDAHFQNLTLSGGNLNPNGWKIFVKGTLTINSTFSINMSGGTGGNGGSASSGSPSGGSAGSAGASGGSTNTVYGGLTGQAGGTGGSGPGNSNGNPGGAGTNGGQETNSLTLAAGASSGAGGTGGSGGGRTGGGGGTAGSGGSAASATNGGTPNIITDLFRWLDPASATWSSFAHLRGGSQAGSAGGGGSGGNPTADGNSRGAGGGGGGSGGAGGVVYIAAFNLVNNGAINATGGTGGNGGNGAVGETGTNQGGGGGGGAGAGGAGGVIVLIYGTLSGSGTTAITGGSAGSVGTGAAGSGSATAGGNGNTGNNGNVGVLLQYTLI